MDSTPHNATLAPPTVKTLGGTLVSKSTLARELDLSPRTLDRWVAQGKFPTPHHRGGKSGGATRWLVQDVNRWIIESLAQVPAAIA